MTIKIGDLFEIPLSGNRIAIGHYVFYDHKNGPLIQIFDYFADAGKANLADAVLKSYLFPPVITGLKAAIRAGIWQVVGKKPVIDFVYPKFISPVWADKTGVVINWFLYDGQSWFKLGPILPVENKELELLIVWHPNHIVDRLETGNLPYPYDEIIANNKFTPGSKGR